MAGILRFGSPEYFQELDRQVQASVAPQIVSGAMKAEQANEIRATAQIRARKQVDKFYGLRNKYDGNGRLKSTLSKAA